MSEPDADAWTRNLIADMRAHAGRAASGPMAGKPLAILTTKGARTGKDRTAIVTYHLDGARYVIAASKGGAPSHPAWYHNLVAHPDVSMEVDAQVVPARATEVTGPERDRLWNDHVAELPEFGDYPAKTDRLIPVFVLEPTS